MNQHTTAKFSAPLNILLLICTASVAYAQQTFLLKNISDKFDFKVQIAKCENNFCEGEAIVDVLEKSGSSIKQTINMPNHFFWISEDRKTVGDLIEIYHKYPEGIIFDDFNFDGAKDLALRKMREKDEGEPFYEIFLWSKPDNKFVGNLEFTKLTDGEFGFFDIDEEKKTLETKHTRGCCWRRTIRYKVAGDRPVKIYVETRNGDPKKDIDSVTTETLVRGKWKKSVKQVRHIYDLNYRNYRPNPKDIINP